jgi:hypothetical protein
LTTFVGCVDAKLQAFLIMSISICFIFDGVAMRGISGIARRVAQGASNANIINGQQICIVTRIAVFHVFYHFLLV